MQAETSEGLFSVTRAMLYLLGVIIFGSAQFLSKKVIKLNFKKKQPKLIQTNRFGFGLVWFFRTKTGSNRFGSVFLIWLDFFSLAQFWLGYFGFGSVFFCLTRFFFEFFWFRFGSVFLVSGL